MASVDYLNERGLTARVAGNRLVVSPASRITTDVRKFIRLHRLELLAEVGANDGEARRTHWRVTRPDGHACTLIGPPMTCQEALASARWHWPDAEVITR